MAEYWDTHIHDLEIATHPVGSREFFRELERYRFKKLAYLPEKVDFSGFRGENVLEVGCGVGIDLARFARGGANVVGIDVSEVAVCLAAQYFRQEGLQGTIRLMDGEAMSFSDNSFDLVYAHGVLQYTPNPVALVKEIHRVLMPGGAAILMMYNRNSWLRWVSDVTGTALEHRDAPFYRMLSITEFRRLLRQFEEVRIVPERFPVPTMLHAGLKGVLYNHLFVRAFNLIPRVLVRPFGWHLLAFGRKK